MGLVVAVVVARADIDEADGQVGRRRGADAERRAERQRCAALQEMPSCDAAKIRPAEIHGVAPLEVCRRFRFAAWCGLRLSSGFAIFVPMHNFSSVSYKILKYIVYFKCWRDDRNLFNPMRG